MPTHFKGLLARSLFAGFVLQGGASTPHSPIEKPVLYFLVLLKGEITVHMREKFHSTNIHSYPFWYQASHGDTHPLCHKRRMRIAVTYH